MIGTFKFLLALGVTACIAFKGINAQRRRYDNYHIYRVEPKTEAQLSYLKSLDGKRDSYVFLDDVLYVNTQIGVLVAPERVQSFEEKLEELRMKPELLDRNAQAHFEDDEVANLTQRGSQYGWKNYQTLESTNDWLKSLVQLYPKQVSLFVAGKSYEGRDLLGVKISYGADKKAIFLEAGIHAREWISPATATYITNELLTSKDDDVRLIAENFDWYILPHTNPDGYVYTHKSDRAWRKTRKPNGNGCYGVDPNRNWDFHWNEAGVSSDPCKDTYSGPYAFSEIETRTLADFLSKIKGNLFLYLSLHSFSQYIMYPYGYTFEPAPNTVDLKRVLNAALIGIKKRYGTKYVGGSISQVVYPASGSSVDWAYAVANVSYAYAYELRPNKWNFFIGFKLPASQIIPSGQETLDSLVAMIKEVGINRSV